MTSETGPLPAPELQTRAVCNCGWRGYPEDALSEPKLPYPKPALQYVSIDIETTGLDPNTCQVLEFAAVIENWNSAIKGLPTFHRLLKHDKITGEPFALALNADLLRRLAAPDTPTISPAALGFEFSKWLKEHGIDPRDCQAAGKNFASFDLQFLKRLTGFDFVKFRHRVIDPAMLYWQRDDDKLPGPETCMQRAGLTGEVAHVALDDALVVVKQIRYAARRWASWCSVTTPTCDDGFAEQLFASNQEIAS
jgi:DNA polymerase III epsilon subunit-like protein